MKEFLVVVLMVITLIVSTIISSCKVSGRRSREEEDKFGYW